MLRTDDDDLGILPAYSPVTTDFGVDFTLPSLRTGLAIDEKNYIGVVLQRQHLDLCFADRILLQQFPLSDGKVGLLVGVYLLKDV